MEIVVDKRIELMAVIQTMDDYWDGLALKYSNKNLFKCKYKENVDNYFKKYKNHLTVKLCSELCNNVQDISTFINLALCYSNPPNLDNVANIEKNINGLIKQNIPYDNFINEIKHFYEETDFESFFEKNRNEYQMLINDYTNGNDLKEYVNKVDIYLGSNSKNYTIIISALLIGCFGIKILSNENITYNYSVISPFDYKENKYIFGSKFSVLGLLWHEISHLTINDLTKNYISQFNISGKIVSNDLIKHFYTDIETVINEYIIRAITIRLFEINYGEKMIGNLIQDNIQKGFTEIKSIRDYILKNCEKDNKFTKEEGYKELMDYVINKI
jgi:hypothetical protein